MKIALIVSIITLASRLLSLVSVQIYMAFFGPQLLALEVYTFALNVPNIVFNILGTSITAIVVPIYAGLLKTDKIEAGIFIKRMFLIIIGVVLFLMLIGFFLAPLLVRVSYFSGYYYYEQFAVFALRVMLLSIFFYGINYLFQGILHSHNKFLLAAMVTIPTSLFIIIYTVGFSSEFGVYGLIYATVIGLSLQGLILALPVAHRLLNISQIKFYHLKNQKLAKPVKKQRLAAKPVDEHMVKALQMVAPLLISASSFQIMSIFNTTMASHLNIVTIQGFVMNLVLVASLSVIYSITSVYLPKLSVQWEEDKEKYRQTLEKIILAVLIFMIPASAAFFILGDEIVSLLVHWGNFDEDSAALTTTLLGIFGFAAAPLGLKEVLDRAYYAQKNSKIPSIVGFLIMAISLLFTILTVNIFGVYTIAIAYVTSFSIGAICLFVSLKLMNLKFFINLLKILFATFLMALVLHAIPILYFTTIGVFLNRLLSLVIPSALGAITYFAVIYFLYRKDFNLSIFRK
ncbi:MAG: polysaccharide biosynthesis C-terminal domain-containing protein [Defluviitaleaceae bacterium]|nr:polysaccharide biosynthesis C-terminal domain-containing protein [Defluviitaleaceae bacterium]